ncbi:MAG: hypothetical protein ACI9P5_000888 [Saprospiraceae bacterium]|jgi:hypothetical protein|tara:strand:- start:557 stop:2020 length:1464 start_codon:yes stop_codon:yes gene_type:complete
MKKVIIISVLISIVISACTEDNKTDSQIQRFINPPIDNIKIPFTEHIINAEKGDTTFYETGSFVIFFPNSFIDENGVIIKGDVKVLFREFNNPIDFYLSGIPMNYDSLGVDYNFESMGMVEITATQNGKALQVNKESQPVVNLASKINNGADNYYFLDTINERWIYKGKTEITDILNDITDSSLSEITDILNDITDSSLSFSNNNQELIKPRKKTDRPSFDITIEPGSVPELSAYDDLSFEITEYEENYKPEYGNILWENVIVEKGQRKGTYNVTFEKGTKKVTFETWPVLSDTEYDKAIADYNSKKIESDRKRDSINTAIEQKRVEQKRIELELERKKIEEYNEIIKARRDSIYLARKRKAEIQNFVYSKFNIDRFGIWNCDDPILQQGTRIIADFYSDDDEKLELTEFSVAYFDFNGIVKESKMITYLKEQKMKVIAVNDNSFYCSSYDDFNNYLFDTKNNRIKIQLKKNNIPKNYNDLYDIVEK